ncbi:uncharacterized protein LOC124811391 [Hydra vulgaris]|uniref:uncharacterized protein LOC124811391 n=1 Tax=Hydra vulgaris TaxID=6087 RepID=UPI0032E9C27C
MGMFSAAKHRAPNSTLCFLSSKLRAIKNNVVNYIEKKDEDDKEKIVYWAVNKARTKREMNKKNIDEIKLELICKNKLKKQKKEDKNRKILALQIQNINFSDNLIAFPELESNQLSDLSDMLSDTVVGRNICHIWFNSQMQGEEVYYGKLEKMKLKNGKQVYVVGYWKDNETYDNDAVDYDISKFELAADIIYGDLMLS